MDAFYFPSHFYIKYDTVEIFNEEMRDIMNEGDILNMISMSQEFENLKVNFCHAL